MSSSTPSFTQFDPSFIPYQDRLLDDIYNAYDFSLGTHEVLLSGSVGSAKSILMAHLASRICFEDQGSKILIGRENLPDLRDTLFTKLAEHLTDEHLKEGYHFKLNNRMCRIEFPLHHSEIIGKSWGDGNFMKLRSYEFNAAFIEELTENRDKGIYDEISMRVGRLPHIKRNLICAATNPDSPSHWAYKHFIEPKLKNLTDDQYKTRHVYYSVTTDNPFLPAWYVKKLRETLDPRMARRMINGEWIEIDEEVVYHSYRSDRNYRGYQYKVDESKPILICFDFNIGQGKPMTCVLGQYDKETDTYHWFAQSSIHGARTSQIMDDVASKGLLDFDTMYEIYGDATGAANDTRSILTDYDIIKRYMSNHKNKKGQYMKWVFCVPLANPPIRKRHNVVNAYCLNDLSQVRFFVYKGCDTLDEGMRLTALKDGGSYIEDDSKEYQHCTTAIGYCIVYKENMKNVPKISATKG